MGQHRLLVEVGEAAQSFAVRRSLCYVNAQERAARIEAVAGLADPLRRSMYDYVSRQPGLVSRDEAAAVLNVSRELAVFHLERLLADGLLEAKFQRVNGRAGPGAGRPRKLYCRSSKQFAVTLPPRNYELAARLLVEALATSPSPAGLARVARDFGSSLGRRVREEVGPRGSRRRTRTCALEALSDHGFEPRETGEGEITLQNCPFDGLANQFPDLVCEMNLAMMQGFAEALPRADLYPSLDPQPHQCCVVFRPGVEDSAATVAGQRDHTSTRSESLT
jgi:predicted ArsR family transcriptional regulator